MSSLQMTSTTELIYHSPAGCQVAAEHFNDQKPMMGVATSLAFILGCVSDTGSPCENVAEMVSSELRRALCLVMVWSMFPMVQSALYDSAHLFQL